jgi:uncharacterized protein (TIGR01777 family)
MRIVIAGGTGFLGTALVNYLAAQDHDLVILSRSGGPAGHKNVRRAEWVPDGSAGGWAREIDGADVVVNLAGAGIADKRWTRARKELIRSSRVLSTRSLSAAVRSVSKRPSVFIQGSAMGFYGSTSGDQRFDESSPPGDDFLGSVCVSWEAEAHPVTALGLRLVIIRTGLALSGEGGVVKSLRLPFQFFVGGPVAPGTQYMSWIHVDDWVGMVNWAISSPAVVGAINATAPEPVTNAEFSRALGRALHRPSWLPVPRFALKALFGEMAEAMLINGQRVVPARATALGFPYRYQRIDEAMAALDASRR